MTSNASNLGVEVSPAICTPKQGGQSPSFFSLPAHSVLHFWPRNLMVFGKSRKLDS
jgi:hypothetical protein